MRGIPAILALNPAEVKFNFRELIVQKDEVIHGYRKKKYESLVGGKFSIEEGHAKFVDDHTIDVGGKRLTGEKILIASGSRPVVPAIEGSDEVPYLTSDLLTNNEPMELWELPRSLIILGGGYIALELGQMFHRFGTEVTILVQRSEQLLAHGYEPELGEAIRESVQERGNQGRDQRATRSVRQDGTDSHRRASRLAIRRASSVLRSFWSPRAVGQTPTESRSKKPASNLARRSGPVE